MSRQQSNEHGLLLRWIAIGMMGLGSELGSTESEIVSEL